MVSSFHSQICFSLPYIQQLDSIWTFGKTFIKTVRLNGSVKRFSYVTGLPGKRRYLGSRQLAGAISFVYFSSCMALFRWLSIPIRVYWFSETNFELNSELNSKKSTSKSSQSLCATLPIGWSATSAFLVQLCKFERGSSMENLITC